jgi:Protein of unknown function (DUF1579)
MRIRKLLVAAIVVGVGLAAAVTSLAIAESSRQAPAAGQPEAKLPPGWTAEDMKTYMEAATPGKMQERLAKDAGVWICKNTMWMAPDTDPIMSEGKSTITTMMDGRFTKCEMEGEMPGMGPYHGFAIYGYDNVSKEFVCTWVDNMGTGFANGVGELSEDGKKLTWKFTANCPIRKKPVVMREIETVTGPNTKTLDMFGTDPKSGREFQMMRIELTKKS